jgi:hypothetical protein
VPTDTNQAGRDLYQGGQGVLNEYAFDPGVCVLPVAEDDPGGADWSPVVVCRLHAPFRTRKTRYDSQKQQNPPVVPTPADTGAFVFTGGNILLTTQLNPSFQRFDWTVVTEYTFVENCRSRPQDGLVLGLPAYTWTSSLENLQGIGQATPANLDGAVAQAGYDAKVGFQQAYVQAAAIANDGNWSYNTSSFFPGQFFDPNMANGGQQV